MTLEIRTYNNYAEFDHNDSYDYRLFISNYLVVVDFEKKWRGKSVSTVPVTYNLYKVIQDKVIFPRGFVDFLKTLNGVETIDKAVYTLKVPGVSRDTIQKVLQPESGFDLRFDQVLAAEKALILKRGIIQMPPGSGKTEVQSAILRLLFQFNPNNAKALVIEPTTELARKNCERFTNYGLDATFYSDNRNINSGIVVAHVTSLLNDLEKDLDLLNDFNIIIWDECHHSQCNTWLDLNFALKNLEYSLGFSALTIDEDKINVGSFDSMSLEEKLIVGSTGRVLLHLNSSYYINKGLLATPVVFQMDHGIAKNLESENNWSTLLADGISSDERNSLIARVINIFNHYDRKIIILVGLKQQAFDIKDFLFYINNNLKIGISFGDGVSYLVEGDSSLKEYPQNIIDYFNEGGCKILIATTHLDEGIDIKNLDVCVLASGGKKDRRLIQRLGRVLRMTKTGKFAYIIDFTDKGNKVLQRHSSYRMALYKNILEIPDSHILKGCSIKELEEKFITMEELSQ